MAEMPTHSLGGSRRQKLAWSGGKKLAPIQGWLFYKFSRYSTFKD
jgi:hypothetical protein